MGSFHRALSLLQLGLGLPALGVEHLRVHVCDDLPGGDKVALVDENVLDAARRLGGDVDLHRFDAAVAAGEAVTQLFRLEIAPAQKDETGRNHNESDPQEPVPVQRAHSGLR